jgi:hypothetical protein
VKEFCERAILLHGGQLIVDGKPEAVIDKYHAMLSTKERTSDRQKVAETEKVYVPIMNEIEEKKVEKGLEEVEEGEKEGKEKEKIEESFPREPPFERHGTFEAEIVDVVLRNEKEEVTHTFVYGERMSICLKIRLHRAMKGPLVGFYIREWKENRLIDIYGTNTRWQNIELGSFERGEEIEVRFLQRFPLPEGMYYTLVAISDAEVTNFCDWQENGTPFTVKREDSVWTGIVDLNSQVLIRYRR